MKKIIVMAALASLPATSPALAQDVASGEKDFGKCRACHSIVAPDGAVLQPGGKTGPNLYGVIGRPVASLAGFSYGPSIATAGAAGKIWDEASLAAYVADPSGWLKETTGEAAAKSKMAFKLAKGGADVAAYLASVTPAAAP